MSRHTRQRQVFLVAAGVAALSVVLASPASAGLWTKAGTAAGTGKATTMPTGGATTITAGTSSSAPLSWPAKTIGSVSVDGHNVTRTNVMTSTRALVASGACAGVVAANNCTDSPAAAATYTWSVTPRMGLWAGAAGAASAELNIGAPSAASVTTGGAADGVISDKDTISVSFNQRMTDSSLCSGWTGASANRSITGNGEVAIKIGNNDAVGTGNDTLTITTATGCSTPARFGTFDLGSTGYLTGTSVTCSGNGGNANELSWTAGTATLTIKVENTNCVTNPPAVASSQIKYTPNTGVTNSSGVAILVTAIATSANVKQF